MNQKSERLRAIRIGAIVAGTLSIGLLHQVTPVSAAHWHNIYQHLCYLPVVVAALMFGWRGGLLAAILAGLSPVPYVVAIWTVQSGSAIDELLEIPLFCLAGVLAGVLGERERAQRLELERTTARLAE